MRASGAPSTPAARAGPGASRPWRRGTVAAAASRRRRACPRRSHCRARNGRPGCTTRIASTKRTSPTASRTRQARSRSSCAAWGNWRSKPPTARSARRAVGDVAGEEAAAVVVEDAVLVERVKRRGVGSARDARDVGIGVERRRGPSRASAIDSTSSSVNATTARARRGDAEVPCARRAEPVGADDAHAGVGGRSHRRRRAVVDDEHLDSGVPSVACGEHRVERSCEQLGTVLRRDHDRDGGHRRHGRPRSATAPRRRRPPAAPRASSHGLQERRGERRACRRSRPRPRGAERIAQRPDPSARRRMRGERRRSPAGTGGRRRRRSRSRLDRRRRRRGPRSPRPSPR